MLDPATWLAAAESVPQGGQKRVRHDCGQGTPMVVYHKDEGWSAYCHRCGEPGFVPRPAESLAERLARVRAREQAEANVSSSIVPPMPPVFDVTLWPDAARVWLYKAGLSNDDIKYLGVYYHEQTDRVVLPILSVYANGEGSADTQGTLIYWQARAYDWRPSSDRPKYLNPRAVGSGQGVAFNFGQHDSSLVITEDFLSAYKVAGSGMDTLSLLGTKLSDLALLTILKRQSHVFVWLDNDTGRSINPGQVAARKVCATLRSHGLKVTNVVTDHDPKFYNRKEIGCLLKELYSPS